MITIDVKATLICLLLAALIVLVIYLVVMARNLVKTLKETNKILEDASVISGIAAEKAVQVDDMITDVQSTVSELSEAAKGQQNLVGAVSNLVKAVGSLAAIFRGTTEEKEDAADKKVKTRRKVNAKKKTNAKKVKKNQQ